MARKSRQMRRKKQTHAAEVRARATSVFLNVPYDADFENLFLAYIAGLSAYGFNPRATEGLCS
jgi:hypothetical protein